MPVLNKKNDIYNFLSYHVKCDRSRERRHKIQPITEEKRSGTDRRQNAYLPASVKIKAPGLEIIATGTTAIITANGITVTVRGSLIKD